MSPPPTPTMCVRRARYAGVTESYRTRAIPFEIPHMSSRRFIISLTSKAIVVAALLGACSKDPVAPASRDVEITQDGYTLVTKGDFIANHDQVVTVKSKVVPGDVHAYFLAYDSLNQGAINPKPGDRSCGGDRPAACVTDASSVPCILDSSQMMSCDVTLFRSEPGTISLRVNLELRVNQTTTQVIGPFSTFSLKVAPQVPAKIVATLPSLLFKPRIPGVVAVAVLDQAGGLIPTARPAAAVANVSSAMISTVQAGYVNRAASELVTITPARAGEAIGLHLSLDKLFMDTSLVVAVVGDDTTAVMSAGGPVSVSRNDADGASGFRIVAGPVHGNAAFAGQSIQYAPTASYMGRDSLRYVATAVGRTDTATVLFNVMPGPYSAAVVTAAANISSIGNVDITDFNDVGQVIFGVTQADGSKRVARWTAGLVETLPSQGSPQAVYGIDNTGSVLGLTNDQLVRWRNGTSMPEPALPFAPVYGRSTSAPTIRMSRGGTLLLLISDSVQYVVRGGTIDTTHVPKMGRLFAVDDAGDFIGNDFTQYPIGRMHIAGGANLVYYIGGRGYTISRSMNNHHVVVGNAETDHIPLRDPFVFDGKMTDVSPAYPGLDDLLAINDSGWMLGVRSDYNYTPVLITNGAFAELQMLLADQSLTVQSVSRLNAAGQILASVKDAGGVVQLMVLTPNR